MFDMWQIDLALSTSFLMQPCQSLSQSDHIFSLLQIKGVNLAKVPKIDKKNELIIEDMNDGSFLSSDGDFRVNPISLVHHFSTIGKSKQRLLQ